MKENQSFECLRCGDCCKWHGYVRLSPDEADRIAESLGLEKRDFVDKMTYVTPDRKSLSLNENEDGSCIFFSVNPPGCEIYENRPSQCRDFPTRWKSRSEKFRCRTEILHRTEGMQEKQ